VSEGSQLRRLGAGLVVVLIVGGVYVSPPSALRHLDLGLYDLLLRLTHRTETSGRIVVVDLDERSLSELGRWPWPRSRLAHLLDAIQAHKPASVAIDMMFPEPDEPAEDQALGAALRAGPSVVGYAFTFPGDPAGRSGCVLHAMAAIVRHQSGNSAGADRLFQAGGAICTVDEIARTAPAAGFLNATPDQDGIFRRIPLLIAYEGRMYPSLALATHLQARGPVPTVPTVLEMVGDAPRSLQIGDTAMPVDRRGNLLLHFRGGRNRFPYVSAADVLAERLAPGTLQGRIVFVGASALGIRKVVATPIDPVFPGVEVHATVVDNILRGDFLQRPPWATALELSLGLGLALGPAWVLGRLGSIGGTLAVAAGGVGLWGAAAVAIRSWGVVISPLFPSLALAGSFAVVTALNVAVERRRAEHGRKRAEETQERLEAQLRQAQKMEALGRLAGGVAHDFNNVLTVIQGRSQILLEALGPEHRLRREAEVIAKAAARAATLTHQLLAFSRKQVLKPRVLNLNRELADAQGMLRPLLREDIAIELVRDPHLGMIRADPGQLHQIIMNLAVNARDAMPGGGRLVFAATNVDLDGAFADRHRGVRPGTYVSLSVRDTGVGMDAQTLANCFEPFFTTKDQGEGTGLGLATVYGIVKQHDGHVRVESVPGQGTTFTVYFPRVEAVPGDEDDAEPAEVAAHGRERILLVEDEWAVRSVTRDMLERAGFTVLTARDGAEALHLADSVGDDIDLLLTDVVMPGLNGPDLARRLRALRPTVRVLYMSGYTRDALAHQANLDAVALLDKPFTPDSLVRTVRAVLDGQLPPEAL
jgi:signal transduction histidine kinase/CheY-like chemotaxis protein